MTLSYRQFIHSIVSFEAKEKYFIRRRANFFSVDFMVVIADRRICRLVVIFYLFQKTSGMKSVWRAYLRLCV